MTKRKFADEEVIKALECCVKSSHFGECFDNKCPLVSEHGCKVGKETLYPYALDLINRQIAEIESLEAENRGFSICLDSAVKTALEIKSKAIKEFDKKFKRASDLICTGSLGSGAADIKNYYRISFDSYEKLIQEMTEKAAHDE